MAAANSTSGTEVPKNVPNEAKNTDNKYLLGEKRTHDNSGTKFYRFFFAKVLNENNLYFIESTELPVKLSRKDLNNLPTRQYLDATVVPILLEGLAQVAKDRPKEPIDFLISYLQNHKSEHKLNVTD